MKAAGIGGFEINTIAMRDDVPKEGLAAFPERPWLSPQWCAAVKTAAEGASTRGMTADIIVGSGWPFGGRFLEASEQTKRVRLVRKDLVGPTTFEASLAELASSGKKDTDEVRVAPRLAFVRLAGAEGPDFVPGTELASLAVRKGRLRVRVPPGPHVLRVGLLETGFTNVKLGAPGADGPVVDHWSAAAVRRYLDHMASGLAPALGGRLGEKLGGPLRASFVDSLELDHANWTDDLPAEFKHRRGYELLPYLPLRPRAGRPGRRHAPRRHRPARPLRLPPHAGRAVPGALPRHLRRVGTREWPARPDAGLRPRDPRARGEPAGGPAGGRELALVGPRPDRGEPDRRQQVRLLGGAPGRARAGQLRGDDERGPGVPRDAGGLQAGDGPERPRRRPPADPPRLQLLAPRGGLPRLGPVRLVVERAEPLVAARAPLHGLRGAPHHRPLVVGVPGGCRPPRSEGRRVGQGRPPVPALSRGLAALVPLPPLAGAPAGGLRDGLRERGRPAGGARRGRPARQRRPGVRHARGHGRRLARAGDGRGDRALRRGGRARPLRGPRSRPRAGPEGRGTRRSAREGGDRTARLVGRRPGRGRPRAFAGPPAAARLHARRAPRRGPARAAALGRGHAAADGRRSRRAARGSPRGRGPRPPPRGRSRDLLPREREPHGGS